jgi:hypothetical protein
MHPVPKYAVQRNRHEDAEMVYNDPPVLRSMFEMHDRNLKIAGSGEH